jgi:hypothetical protein
MNWARTAVRSKGEPARGGGRARPGPLPRQRPHPWARLRGKARPRATVPGALCPWRLVARRDGLATELRNYVERDLKRFAGVERSREWRRLSCPCRATGTVGTSRRRGPS